MNGHGSTGETQKNPILTLTTQKVASSKLSLNPTKLEYVGNCLELHDGCGTQAIRKLGEPLLIYAGALTGFGVSVRLVASAAVRTPPEDIEAS